MLIATAVWDTIGNGRTWMTDATLHSLAETVDWSKHRLIVVDNGSCLETRELLGYEGLQGYPCPYTLMRNKENLGTAAAINRAWRHREPGEHCVKMDNDVTFHQAGWADRIEDVFERDPEIGICGLKRNDLEESPWAEGGYKSTIRMLPHERGQRWLIVEEVKHVIGTCQGYSSALLDKIGYLVQPALYGFDDSLSGVRARVAGFKSAFLCGFEIEHLDPGGDAYGQWKRDQAAQYFPDYNSAVLLYESGAKDVYYDGL